MMREQDVGRAYRVGQVQITFTSKRLAAWRGPARSRRIFWSGFGIFDQQGADADRTGKAGITSQSLGERFRCWRTWQELNLQPPDP